LIDNVPAKSKSKNSSNGATCVVSLALHKNPLWIYCRIMGYVALAFHSTKHHPLPSLIDDLCGKNSPREHRTFS
jgi:hypothetical protein